MLIRSLQQRLNQPMHEKLPVIALSNYSLHLIPWESQIKLRQIMGPVTHSAS